MLVRSLSPRALAVITLLAAAGSAHAQTTIVRWTFNSVPPDGSTGTGTQTPAAGVNAASGVISTFSPSTPLLVTFASGNGSSDPATSDDSGLATTTYALQGLESGQRGMEFRCSTVGFEDVVFTTDIRFSDTVSRWLRVSYSTDGGVTFVPFPSLIEGTAGDTWFNGLTFSLADVPAADNNPDVRVRVSPVFSPVAFINNAISYAPDTGYDTPSGNPHGTGGMPTGAGGGTLRYDMTTFSGAALLPTSPSGGGLASPATVCAGDTTLLIVNVTGGQNPASTGLTVRADASSIGLSPTLALFDDGTNGDITAGDGQFARSVTVAPSTAQGAKSLAVTIADAQSRSGSAAISLLVGDCSQASGAPLVISGFFGGGGNSGSPFNADFVELFNRSDRPINLENISLQFAGNTSAAGFDGTRQVNFSGTIPAGGYRLVQVARPAATSPLLPLPSPDFLTYPDNELTPPIFPQVINGFGMDNSSARLVLVAGRDPLGPNCGSARVIDFIGYGNGTVCFEGVATVPALANNLSAVRKSGGCQDTNQNFNDFVVAFPNDPFNAATTPAPCAGVATSLTIAPAFTPAAVCVGSPTLITANVFGGGVANDGPYAVTADLSAFGGPAALPLNDDGLDGDATAADGLYSASYTPTAPGLNVAVAFTAIDLSTLAAAANTADLDAGGCEDVGAPVVISALFGGGGNTNAAYNADFVELFNRSTETIDLTGWSLQYASATGASGFGGTQLNFTGSIGPGQFRLIQMNRPGTAAVGAALPTPDFLGFNPGNPSDNGITMDNQAGRLALVNTTLPLGTACGSPAIVDFVGYGVQTACFEGAAPAGTLSNLQMLRRALDGCQDTNENFHDLAVVPTAEPRNSASPVVICNPFVCVADFNGDTTLNDDDLGEYITSYFEIFAGPGGYAVAPCDGADAPFDTQGYRADITGDCTLNDDDLSLFITLFFIGCE